MKRIDPIAVIALVAAAAALYLSYSRGRQPAAVPATVAYHYGDLYLEPQGMGACKVNRKVPDPIRVQDGDWVIWRVFNNCTAPATLEVVERRRGPGNSTQEDNPLGAVFNSPIPGRIDDTTPGRGEVVWLVKQEADLKPAPTTRRDKWSFKWKLNNATQQDPEIEIEYRRAR
jgi:hypothetical protein